MSPEQRIPTEHPLRTIRGGDKGYDVASFVAAVRTLALTPHVAQRDKGSAIDRRTTRHLGYTVSQQRRKLIEQVFGWMKTVGGLRKLRHRGGERVDWIVAFFEALNSQESAGVIGEEIARTAPRLFPDTDDTDPAIEPSFLSETAFVVGFATCWLAMTSMGGAK